MVKYELLLINLPSFALQESEKITKSCSSLWVSGVMSFSSKMELLVLFTLFLVKVLLLLIHFTSCK